MGGYMILFGVNRKYGIWMNIYTDLWGRGSGRLAHLPTRTSSEHIAAA